MNFESRESELENPEKIIFRLKVEPKDFENIPSILIYLANSLIDFFTKNPCKNYVFYPMVFDIGEDLEVSEKTFWAIVADHSDGYEYEDVMGFVQRLMPSVTDKNGALIYSDAEHFFFSYMLIEYLDYIISLEVRNYKKGKMIIELFYFYLKRCDMEFETFQDEYILKSLDYCEMLDPMLRVKFLEFRLSNGQQYQKNFEFYNRFLEEKKFLKIVIDRFISSNNEFIRYSLCTYLLPCVSIYGSATNEIDEVLAYVKKKLNNDLEPLSKIEKIRVARYRKMCDAVRGNPYSKNVKLDTGFHCYDYKEDKWS